MKYENRGNRYQLIIQNYSPNTAHCTPKALRIGIMCRPFVVVLRREGFKQSPLKRIRGFSALNCFNAVANL